MKYNFGKRVLQARQELGLTQKQLAEALGKTTQSVKLVEKGASSMKLETFLNLCKITNKTPNFYMQDECRQAKIENIISMISCIDFDKLDLLNKTLDNIINSDNEAK